MGGILLVDGDGEFRESLARQLAAYGFEVGQASSAPQALDVVARMVPRVIVLDVDLPTIDGLELLRHVRSRGHYLRIRAIVLTGSSSRRHILDAARLRVAAYLSKRDFDFPTFLQRLVSVIGEAPPAQILFPSFHGKGLEDNSVSSAGAEVESRQDRLPRLDWNSFLSRLSARALKPEAMPILQQCCSQEVTMGDLEASVRTSPLLAARVLTMANSAAFSRGAKVVRLTDAIGLIGIDQLRNLVSSSFFEDHFLSELQEEVSWRAWQFGLACGRLMEEMKGTGLGCPPGSEYLLGVGLSLVPLIFAQNMKQEMPRIRDWHEKRRTFNINLFEDLFGIPVDEASRAMLEKIGIPAMLVEPLVEHLRIACSESEVPFDQTSLALDVASHFASAMFFPLSPFFPLRPLTRNDVERLPSLANLPDRWQAIRQEVLIRSFELARDSEVVREIVARPYFTRREDILVELRTDSWAASFGPIRLFLNGICRLREFDAGPRGLSKCALVLVSDDPRTLVGSGDEGRPLLVLHRKHADPSAIRKIPGVRNLALPCSMASLTQAVHALGDPEVE